MRIWIARDQRPFTSNKKTEDDPNFNSTSAAPAYQKNINEMYYPRGSLLTAALMYGNENAARALLEFGADPNLVVMKKLKLAVGTSSYRQVTSPLLAGLLGKVSEEMWHTLIAKGMTQLPNIEKFEYNLPEVRNNKIKDLLANLPLPGDSNPKIDLTELW